MIVKKFGGSSLSDRSKILNVAKSIIKTNEKQVIVVSAPYGLTNKLNEYAYEISKKPSLRELDQMLVTGEMINASLMAIALNELGAKAISLNAYSLGIFSSDDYGNGIIKRIDRKRIEQLFNTYDILVVTGFQGINNHSFVTLGRGGSDTTALAIAALFDTTCLIYTDVNGVYTIDPRESKKYLKLKNISYDNMVDLSIGGGKVLAERAAVIAKNYHVPTMILKSLEKKGTNIVNIESNGPKAVSFIYLSKKTNNNLFISANNKSFYKDNRGKLVGISIVGDFMLKGCTHKMVENIMKELKIRPIFKSYKDNLLFIIINKKNKNKFVKKYTEYLN